MSNDTATFQLEGNVFIEESILMYEEQSPARKIGDVTAQEVAREAWSQICSWVREGYLPIITVILPDGSKATVDLEDDIVMEETPV